MIHLLIATRNAHKVAEIQEILGPECRCHALSEFDGAPEVIEDGMTFAENAVRKGEQVAAWFARRPESKSSRPPGGWFVLADDSGLEVDALDGAPGVQSARFARPENGGAGNAPDAANNAKLLRLLAGVPEDRRTARFRCVLALVPVRAAGPTGEGLRGSTRCYEGSCAGRIGFTPSGKGGFGYDPLFRPDGFTETFAELGPGTKNRLSHRARALEGLRKHLREVMSRASAPSPGE